MPNAIVISAQVEVRFYNEGNRFGAPTYQNFKSIRNAFNTYLKRMKYKDNILIIAGSGRLDNRDYYRDQVQLNRQGLLTYMSIIKTTVSYVLANKF